MRLPLFPFAVTMLLATALVVGQQPARDTRRIEPVGTAGIRGRVLAADTGQPLRHTWVSLEGPPRATESSTLTDLNGRFEFKELPPGRYRLTAAKRGYLQLEYGQRRPRQQGKPIDLVKDAVMEGFDFVLPPAGVISGTVTDDVGEPVEHARVSVMQRQFYQGLQRLVPVAPASYLDTGYTNDLGQYRIYGLPPGTYYVGVRPTPSRIATDDSFSFAPTYYPGTSDITQATRIVLKIGQQRGGADVTIAAGRPARVSGIVLNSLGQPAAGARVSSSQTVGDDATSGSYEGPRAMAQADGRFVLNGMPPGAHTLYASVTNSETGDSERGEVVVSVTGAAAVDGVTLMMLAPVRVTGHLRFDPAATPPSPAASKLVALVSGVRNDFAPCMSPVRQPDGSFELRGIPPGPARRFGVQGLPDRWGIKAVRYQGRDITDGGIDIGANMNLNGIEILLSNNQAELTGTVTDAAGQSVGDYVVVVFSDNPARWAPGRSLMALRPDQNGGFSTRDLRPGNYFAVAVEYLAAGDEYDPEVLAALREVATRLTLGDGEKRTIQLRIVTEGGRREAGDARR